MILLLSDEHDISTNEVIDWLEYFNIPFIRINDTSYIQIDDIKISNSTTSWKLYISEAFSEEIKELDSANIKKFWYRRGKFNVKERATKFSYYDDKYPELFSHARNHLLNNQTDLINFLYSHLKENKYLGYFHDNFTNKLYNLFIAKKLGFFVPASQILNTKKQLVNFIKVHNQCITKGINENGIVVKDKMDIGCLTQFISESDLVDIPETFSNSLVQECIDKLFELRIFYLEKQCYAAAIFSQLDEQTKIDFRNYNHDLPNRVVPFELPKEIIQKLVKFMESIDMISGSIDMIVTPKNEFYFLEVNPIGQFSWISKKCNYGIEKIIAEYFK